MGLWPSLSISHDFSHFITFPEELSPPLPGRTHLKQVLGDYYISYLRLVFSWEWIFGVGMLSLLRDTMLVIPKCFVINRRREEALKSLHVINFYSVMPALKSTLLNLTSCSWWWYHVTVKGNCFVFWFYIWVWSLPPLDRISFQWLIFPGSLYKPSQLVQGTVN